MTLLTQTYVVAEHVEDALAALPRVPTALTRAPLRHLHAAVAHIVGSHDGAWLQRENMDSKGMLQGEAIFPFGTWISFSAPLWKVRSSQPTILAALEIQCHHFDIDNCRYRKLLFWKI